MDVAQRWFYGRVACGWGQGVALSTTITAPPELDEAYRATFARLERIFRSRGLTHDDAQDLAQEAATRTLSHLERHGRRADDLTPLMNTIAKNLVVERFRTGGRELPFVPDERCAGTAPDPADTLTTTECRQLVQDAIAELPARQRLAIQLWLDGARPPEIARVLGLKRNAADALLHRARRFLSTRLEQCRETAWGAVILVGTQLRTRLRRAAFWVGPTDGAGLFAPIAVGIGALAVLSLFPVGVGTHPQNHRPPVDRTSATPATARAEAAIGRLSLDGRGLGQHETGAGDDAWRPIEHEVRQPRFKVSTPPIPRGSGDRESIWVQVWQEDKEDPGITESALLHVTNTTCDLAPRACGEE